MKPASATTVREEEASIPFALKGYSRINHAECSDNSEGSKPTFANPTLAILIRPTLAKPTLAKTDFWAKPTLAKPTLANVKVLVACKDFGFSELIVWVF